MVVLIETKKRPTDGLMDSYISRNHCDFFTLNLSSSRNLNNKATGFLGYTGTTRFYNEKQNEIDENYNEKRKPAMSLVEPSKAIIEKSLF